MPDSLPLPESFLNSLLEAEAQITTRESAVALAQETAAEFCKALDTMNGKNIHALRNSPFGSYPLQFWMSQGHELTAGHVSQMEYLQTIWEDLDNHFKGLALNGWRPFVDIPLHPSVLGKGVSIG